MDCCPLPPDWVTLAPNGQIRNSVKVIFRVTPESLEEMRRRNQAYESKRGGYRIDNPHISRAELMRLEEEALKQRVDEESMSTGDQPETPPPTPL